MSIVRDGVNITQQTFDEVKIKSAIWRSHHNNFEAQKILLMQARDALDRVPRPWMEDCVYDAIKKITEALEILK